MTGVGRPGPGVTGVDGSGPPRTGVDHPGPAGTGVAGSGPAGTGVDGSGVDRSGPGGTGVAGTAVAGDPIARLAARIGDALAGHGPGGTPPVVRVAALGVRDELAAPAAESPWRAAGPDADDLPTGADLTVFLYGHHAIVGPLPPAAGPPPACPRCLTRRWQSVRATDLRNALELGGGTRAAGPSPHLTPFSADALAALIGSHLAASRTALPGSRTALPESRTALAGPPRATAEILHVDLETLRVRRLPLVPDPECPSCGRREPDSAAYAALTLTPAVKRAPDDFRVRDLDEFPLDVEAFANPVCGALSAAVLHDLTSTTTAAALGSFTLRSGAYLRETLYGGHTNSYATSAKVAVLEGLERAAGLRARGRTAAVRASLRQLRDRGDDALDPAVCGLYSDEFYQVNHHLTRFTPDEPINWVWGSSLRDGRPVLVPEVLAYYHTPPAEARFVQETSNGCASGGCLAEAVYFGLMEAVERDAFLIAWYARADLPEIDPASSTRPATRQMVDRLAMYGYRARFFDARVTFAIPVVTAVAERVDGGLGTLAFGGGASLDPEEAMGAALREIATDAVKLRVRTLAAESRLRAMAVDFTKVLGLHDHPLLYGLPQMRRHAAFLLDSGAPARPLRERFGRHRPAPPVSTDLTTDLETCVAQVTAAGFDVVVVDQTMPEERDIGLHTVKVIVPGLVPIDFGWQRQRAPLMARVRTAGKESGLADRRDLTPDDLNPAPHPFP